MANEDLDRLLIKLNKSGVQQQNPPLYEVIAALLKRLRETSNIIAGGGSGGGSNITNINNRIYQIVEGGDSGGGDGEMGPPGARGADGAPGATGPTGATGPPFPSFIYNDPDPPEEPMVIPGARGATGATGATGPPGTGTILMLAEETNYDEVIQQIITPGRGGAIGNWQHIDSISLGATTEWVVPDLENYVELLLVGRDVVKSVNTTSSIRVSDDNGSTYFDTSGDYINILASGAIGTADAIQLHATASTAARSFLCHFIAWNPLANIGNLPKICFTSNVTGNSPQVMINTFNTLNALKVYNTSETGNMTTGDLWLMGR